MKSLITMFTSFGMLVGFMGGVIFWASAAEAQVDAETAKRLNALAAWHDATPNHMYCEIFGGGDRGRFTLSMPYGQSGSARLLWNDGQRSPVLDPVHTLDREVYHRGPEIGQLWGQRIPQDSGYSIYFELQENHRFNLMFDDWGEGVIDYVRPGQCY